MKFLIQFPHLTTLDACKINNTFLLQNERVRTQSQLYQSKTKTQQCKKFSSECLGPIHDSLGSPGP